MLEPTVDVVVSTSGGSPVTVTVSCNADGAIWKFTRLVCPTSIWRVRLTVVKPANSAVIL